MVYLVSVARLQRVYAPLNLSETVFSVIVQAHCDVLETGLATGNERVVVIDLDLGEVFDDNIGTPNEVYFSDDMDYTRKYLIIHNHPRNNTFSPQDIYTFLDVLPISCSVVQGHDGSVYVFHKLKHMRYALSSHYFDDLFYDLLESEKGGTASFEEVRDIFIQRVVEQFHLSYRKVV